MSEPKYTSVAALCEQLLPAVAPHLEPGEQVQVVVPAQTGAPPAVALALDFGGDVASGTTNPVLAVTGGAAAFVGRRQLQNYFLVATDRAFIVLTGQHRGRAPVNFRARCSRDVRLGTSWRHKITGLDQPYVIGPTWEDHVRAANDALDALAQGRPWALGPDVDRHPVKDVSYPARKARRAEAKRRRGQP